MKASLNGVPHLSILDGWWIEGFDKRTAGPSAKRRRKTEISLMQKSFIKSSKMR